MRNLPRPVSRALNKRVFSALPLASFATLARDSAPIRLRVDTGTYLMSRRRNEEPPQGFDRWLRRASYAAAPVAAAGSVAVLLKSRKIVPSAQRAIDEWHSVAKKAGDAVSQVQSVADQISRSRFLPKAAKPGEIGRALSRSPQFSGNTNTGFMTRLRNKLLGTPGPGMKLFSVPRDVRFLATNYPLPAITFACSPEENLFLHERLRKQGEKKRLSGHQRIFRLGHEHGAEWHFGGYGPGGQLRDVDNNTYANPASAAMGTQRVYTEKDKQGNPIPTDVTLRHAQVGRYVWNQAARAERPLRRGYGMTRDLKDVVAGNPRRTDSRGRPRPREWEKAWFKRVVGIAGAAAAGMSGLAYMKHFPYQGPKIPFTNQHAPSRDAIIGKYEGIKDAINRHVPDFFPKRQHGFSARFFSTLSAPLRETSALNLLDRTSGDWDVRDARGNSARVFAGGTSPRDRRPKYWWEKARNQRILAAVGIAGAASAAFAGGRKTANRPLKSFNPLRNPFRQAAPGMDGNVVRNTPPPVRARPAHFSAVSRFSDFLDRAPSAKSFSTMQPLNREP